MLGAYQYLLDWHRDQYINDDPEKWAKGKTPRLYQTYKGEWRLTTDERKRILLNNIYGVDIDPQAVEVTKLSLLLKVLEGEDEQSIGKQMALFQERVLPDLANNIKCGNSLIGPDFHENQQMTLLDEEEMYRVNAFDWEAEFSEIMKKGGFDAVVGNPPYIFTREQIIEIERQYFSKNYKATYEKHNTYILFMESMLRLLNVSGRGGFIVPNSWLTIESSYLLRNMFIPYLHSIADLNYTVFDAVSMEPCVFIISGKKSNSAVLVLRAKDKDAFNLLQYTHIQRDRWSNESKQRIVFSPDDGLMKVVDKIIAVTKSINHFFDVRSGLQAYEKGKGRPPQTALDVKNHIFDRDNWEDENSFRYLQGKDVGRYQLNWSGMWLQYGHWLSQPREFEIFSRPRVLLREITADLPYCLKATYLSEFVYLNNKSILNILHPENDIEELICLLGILNSKVISIYYKQRAVKSSRKIFPKVVIRNMREFPYPIIAKKQKKALSILVEQMLAMNKKFSEAKTPQAKNMLQRQIEATDKQIDQLVYKLYDLTNEEIKIVESET